MHPINYSLIVNLAALAALLAVSIALKATPTEAGMMILVAVLIQTHAMQRFSEGSQHPAEGAGEDDEPGMGFLADLDSR